MKLSLNWLNTYLEKNIKINEFKEGLDKLDFEIDFIKKIGGEGFFLSKIIEIKPHPNSSILNICKVEYLENKERKEKEVVCGASNVKVGLYTILANEGTLLPSGIKLKKKTIRGVESGGMLLSYEEFGLEHIQKNGIIDEKPELIEELIKEDYIIHIGIPANRVDVSSVRGLATELGSYFGIELKKLYNENTAVRSEQISTFKIQDKEGVSIFSTLEIKNIKIKKNYEKHIGLLMKITNLIEVAPINIANYITLDLGVPLHLYDLNLTKNLTIGFAKKKESFISLKEEEIIIEPGYLVIQGEKDKTLVIGGIIGGKDIACTIETKNLLIEAAIFNKEYYIKAYRELGIQNTSTYYFNRGINYHNYLLALEYFNNFFEGDFSKVKIENNQNGKEINSEIFLSFEEFYKMTNLGTSLEEIKTLLEKYNYKVKIKNKETDGLNQEMGISVIPPLWKTHIENSKDLIEEIVRLGNFSINKESIKLNLSFKKKHTFIEKTFEIEDLLIKNGYKEVICFSFVENNKSNLFIPNGLGNQKYLRESLFLSIKEHMDNIVEKKLGIEYSGKIFEISKVFKREEKTKEIIEPYNLCLGILNNKNRFHQEKMENSLVSIIGRLEENFLKPIKYNQEGDIYMENKKIGEIKVFEAYIIAEFWNLESLLLFEKEKEEVKKSHFIVRDYACLMNKEKIHDLVSELNKMKENLTHSIFDDFKDSYGIRIKYYLEKEEELESLEKKVLNIFSQNNITLK